MSIQSEAENSWRQVTAELLQSKDAWRRQAAILQAALHEAADGVVIAGPGGELLLVGGAAAELMGMPGRGMALGIPPASGNAQRPGATFFLADQETVCPPERDPLRRALIGEPVTVELFAQMPGAPQRRRFEVAARPLHDAKGLPDGAVVFFRDRQNAAPRAMPATVSSPGLPRHIGPTAEA